MTQNMVQEQITSPVPLSSVLALVGQLMSFAS